MTGRLARFSCSFDGNPDGDVDLVLNAGNDKGFTVVAVQLNWLSEDMTGSSDVPVSTMTRFTGSASGGTAGVILSHTDGDVPAASALINPSSLGASPVRGPAVWPGVASFTGTVWYTHGGQHLTDFAGSPIYVAAGDSLRVRTTNCIGATAHFHENLAP